MASMQGVRRQLEDLKEALDPGIKTLDWLDEEKPEDAAGVVQLMAEVEMLLATSVSNFMSEWDFAEDCRRGKLAGVGA